jgi:hypothetical protein
MCGYNPTLRGGDTNAKLVREKGEQLAEKRLEMEALSRKNGELEVGSGRY